MIAFLSLFFHMTSVTTCYQRLSGNTNHNNVDQKPTHLLTGHNHYPHNHRWNEPYFDLTMPKNITSLVGKSAYLGCRVKHLGNKTVAWIRHRDLHILTVGTYTYATDQRFQTSYHRDIDEWTLQIKWAQERDAGVYECQISTQPVRSFSVFLNIVVPTAAILGGPDLYVDKGSTINLTCVIKFSPEPPTHIFWYHQDKVLSEENSDGRLRFKTHKSEETKSILLINDADLSDSGTYTCYPSNTEITSVRVHVLQGERPEAMQTNAVDAITLQTSHHFAITTIVATLILLHILTAFIQRLNNVTQNIVVNCKILCNDNCTSNANMKLNCNGTNYNVGSNSNSNNSSSSSNRYSNSTKNKNNINWTNISKQHCRRIYAMKDCIYYTTLSLHVTLKSPTTKVMDIIGRRKENFIIITLYSKIIVNSQNIPSLLLKRPSSRLISNKILIALDSTRTPYKSKEIHTVRKEYSRIYKFALR